MAKVKQIFVCQNCGYESAKWLGKCNSCNEWNSFVEESVGTKTKSCASLKAPIKLNDIHVVDESRTTTGMKELDRVLGGGIVKGSLVLVGGDPGIGKSTLLLQICESIGRQDKKVLYISGEESVVQIKIRGERLKVATNNLSLLSETNMTNIIAQAKHTKPDIIILDSIQTVYCEEVTSAPGSVSQVREATHALMNLGKVHDITILIVGHVTKEGSLAGPRVLEHMVDTVLYFEGERHASFRILRAVKNRFGSTNEIGVFEMVDVGLIEVKNPSELMLTGRPLEVAGSAVSCNIEGTRPMLIEVQSLTSFTSFGMPRRTATGIDYNRMVLLIAVLDKRLGLDLGSYDAYVNLAGGIKVNEPALDLAVVVSIASSFKNKPIDSEMVIIGEVGLTGEVRAVTLPEKRVMEAAKLGFKKCIIPKSNKSKLPKIQGIEVIGVDTVKEALEAALIK
ncbi:MAG: DNA repair protein RadA [Epulopiscium sp. Nele67-Bin002]|nr:MAG: DNA repair protein RadA [Epulopiscium sp. Nuni2H_MBin001]OON91718.1 MAG: DNA repair protein RadA [Epulopiscium sp. Nele67-Bin002]OON94282.1 MAG: DNA repair protein RadA [Epulopiscium sp. Nele67-Bin001]